MTPAETHLMELLALIHEDGGHHADEHGLEKSVEAAIEKVNRLRAYSHGNNNYKAFYENLVGQFLNDYGQTASEVGPVVAGQMAAAKAREAIDTLRDLRTSLMLEVRKGHALGIEPEVPCSAAGLLRTVRAIASESSVRGQQFERALLVDWLSNVPSDPILELAFSDDPNPYRWLVESIRNLKHRESINEF